MPPSASVSHLSPAELSYLHTSLSSHPPLRPDARSAGDFRPFSAETGVLPNTMGSAHVGFADGREAVVGVRAEVERSTSTTSETIDRSVQDVSMGGTSERKIQRAGRGKKDWITLSLVLPGLRDDDKDLVFLEEMLREILVVPSAAIDGNGEARSLQDALFINYRWHWRLYIDVVLISPPEGASANYPLPLLSMAVHLALRDTRIPRLKSEGDEDPIADDDWEASVWLYEKTGKVGLLNHAVPPVTLLVMVAGENVIFDPSSTELAVADGVLAVSVGRSSESTTIILGLRMMETPARDTMKGVPRNDGGNSWDIVPGVWRPKIGGLKRAVFTKVMKQVVGDIGKEVLSGLDAFITQSG